MASVRPFEDIDLSSSPGPIMVVPTHHQLRAGAVWVTIANWADEFSRSYGSVTLMTPDGLISPVEARDGASWTGVHAEANQPGAVVTALRLAAKDVRAALWGSQFAKRARRINFAQLGRHPFVWQHHDLFQRAGLELARGLDVPLVVFVDAPIVWEARKWGVKRRGWGWFAEREGESKLLRSADIVACVSDEVADAVGALGVDQSRILITPCSAQVPDDLPARDESRRILGVDEKFVVGWVGSFRRFHALDLLVDALVHLQAPERDVQLMLVGDGPERRRIVERCERALIPTIHTGALPNVEVYGYIATFDLGVLTAGSSDSFHYSPLKVKEYMAMGVGAVVPSVGEMLDLQDGREALLYTPGDVDSLSAALLRGIEDQRFARDLGERGREKFELEYGMNAQVGALMSKLASV